MFNVGDFVRVKNDLEVDYFYSGLSFNRDMKRYRGRVFKIASTHSGNEYKLENVDEWFWNDDMLESISEEVYNMERDRIYCADCGREITSDDEKYEVEGGNRIVCEECYEHYSECEHCHEMVYEDDMYYDDDDDCYYCEECYHNRPRNLISGYHDYHRGFKLLSGKGEEVDKNTRYSGTELEMENDRVVKDCIYNLRDKFDAILSHDGSLDSCGAMEWVDDARTMQNHYEVYEDKKAAFEMLRKNGYRSHDTSTCGLHIHVSRPYQKEIDSLPWDSEERKELIDNQNEIIDRIILVLETYKDEIMKFTRRKSFGWCQWLSDVVYNNKGKITSMDFIKKNKGECMGHRRALNLENHDTIEFRIFKGTLNVDTYYACLELVNNIMDLCGNLSLSLDKITWNKLTKGKFVSNYVKENHIWTTRKVVDTSEIDKIWEDIKNKKKGRIVKKVFVELNKWYEDMLATYNDMKDSEKWNDIYNLAYKMNNYTSGLKSLKNYQNEKRYNDIAYRLNDLLSYDLCFENAYQLEIKKNLKDIVNELLGVR